MFSNEMSADSKSQIELLLLKCVPSCPANANIFVVSSFFSV